jgi:hypothetical protein
MEIEGHPTQDLIEELERRGAIRIAGTAAGPHADAVGVLSQLGESPGVWLFLTAQTYDTGFDEIPS